MDNFTYTETTHPLTGDLVWVCEYTPESIFLVEKFIKENYHEGYTLSICDTITNNTLEIKNSIEEIIDKVTSIIGCISSAEHSFVAFVGTHWKKQKYLVGMNFTRGIIDIPAVYKIENGKFVLNPVLSTMAKFNCMADKLTAKQAKKEELFRATVIKYIGDNAVATATGTFAEVIEMLNITEIRKDTYYKLARYNDISYDYTEDVSFGCSCKKRGGLEINEGIFCNAYLNHMFKEYLKGNTYMGTFRNLVRWYFYFQDATQVSKNSINFEEWSQSFFKDPWCKVSNLNDFKETSGLYALILDKYAKCYIGQAQDIKKRVLEHWRKDSFTTKGIDLFRAKDTTRIYVMPLSQKEIDKNEYHYVGVIPSEYRLNFLQGGTITFHEAQNTSPIFEENHRGLENLFKRLEQEDILAEKNANLFEEKAPN